MTGFRFPAFAFSANARVRCANVQSMSENEKGSRITRPATSNSFRVCLNNQFFGMVVRVTGLMDDG
jgi:hypothetical protein